MNRTLISNKKPFTLGLDLKSSKPMSIKIEAKDKTKPMTFFYRQEFEINGERKFDIPFPQSPNALEFRIYPANYKSYNDYMQFGKNKPKTFGIVDSKILPLQTKINWLSKKDKNFIKFAHFQRHLCLV